MKKVSIIGAGNVGATLAEKIVLNEISDVVLIDLPELESIAKGKALDILQAAAVLGSNSKIEGGSDYQLIKNSDIIVITAGVARKPGMSREDLLKINANIVKDVSLKVKDFCPDSILIIVTNPLDAMCYVGWKVTGFKKQKVIGMAGILDSARMRSFIANRLNISPKNIQTTVLGTHGDTMVGVVSCCNISGISIRKFLDDEKLNSIIQRTKDGGAEIVKLLKTGSAYYAPAASCLIMIKSILNDEKRILPCSVYLEGEYGISGVFLGVPVKLGGEGIEEIIELELTAQEKESLEKSADSVRRLIKDLENASMY